MTPAQLSTRLTTCVNEVACYLYPQGRRVGQDYVVGGIDGDAGDSMKIHLTGQYAGHWKDWATDDHGDLLDLWCAARHLDLPTAMQEAANYLGLRLDGERSRPKKHYRSPERHAATRRLQAEGPVLAYLKARGLTETTLAAFKIAEQSGTVKFPELPNNPGTLVFPFLRDGKLINQKYLALERPHGKKAMRQDQQAEPCLFGWHTLSPQTRWVVLVEGEIDAMTLYQFGIPALSVPNGGGSGAKQDWIESDFDHLQRFDTLYLGLDMDSTGHEGNQEILRRLGPERCRIVKWPHKDPNECLAQGFTKADFDRCIHAAKTQDPEELKAADSYMDAVLNEFFPKPDTPQGAATPWPEVDHLLRFRPGEVTVWVGYSGHGKSLVLNHLAAASLAHADRWCIASMEMPPARTLMRLVRQLTGRKDPAKESVQQTIAWLGDRLWLFDLLGTAKVDRMLEVFGYAAQRYQISQFVIDSLAKCGMDEDDYNTQKAVVERASDFAHRYGAHIHLVCHARKGSNENNAPGKMDVKGTGAITDLADNVITVWRNKPKEEAVNQASQGRGAPDPVLQGTPDAVLVVSKQRHTGWEGDIALWFDPHSLQYLKKAEHFPKIYVAPRASANDGGEV